MRRFMAMLALPYAGGLLLAEYVPLSLSVLWLMTLAALAVVLLCRRIHSWPLAMLLLVAGWLNLTSRTAVVSPVDLRLLLADATPAVLTLRGRLKETPALRMFVRDEEESYRTLAVLETEALRSQTGWQAAHGLVLVMTPGVLPSDFYAGQQVEIGGIVATPRSALAPGLFDYRAYLRRQGIHYQIRATSSNDWHIATPHPASPPLADRFIVWAKGILKLGLPEDESLRLLWAMTLGWKTALTNEVDEPFMRSGTMHIFAISGLHIALIAGILVSLLRVLQVPRGACGFVVVPLIWFYTAATGWQSSAIRSTVMMTVIIVGWAFRRPSDLINSLAAAGLLILVWDPQQLFQASFQLSFFVVLSIALLLPPLERLRDRILKTDPFLPPEMLPRWRRWLNDPLRWFSTALATSLAAWLGSLPLTAYYFHLFSPVTLLANLVIVPLSSLALMCNLGSLVSGAAWPALAELFNWSAWFWMWGMIRASELAARLPAAFCYVRAFTPAEMLLYYGLLTALLSGWLLTPQRRRWTLPGLGLAATLYGGTLILSGRTVTLTAIPLNGGSAVFCDLPGRRHDLLVDCGQSNAVEFVTTPFLHAQGINRLPQFLLTHGDLRQMGGAEAVMRDFQVAKAFVSGVRQLSPIYRRVLAGLAETPERLHTVKRGDNIGPWQVLHPSATDRFRQADDAAVVLYAELQGVRVLLLSDLGRSGQEALMERHVDLGADIVIAGMPTQGEPLCDSLLARIAPQVVVIVDSEFPATERAPANLRARLATHGVPVLYSREVGAAQVRCHNSSWRLRTMQGTEWRSAVRNRIHRLGKETE